MQKIRRVVEEVARNLEEHSHICSKQKRESWSPIVLEAVEDERGREREKKGRIQFTKQRRPAFVFFCKVLMKFLPFP